MLVEMDMLLLESKLETEALLLAEGRTTCAIWTGQPERPPYARTTALRGPSSRESILSHIIHVLLALVILHDRVALSCERCTTFNSGDGAKLAPLTATLVDSIEISSVDIVTLGGF